MAGLQMFLAGTTHNRVGKLAWMVKFHFTLKDRPPTLSFSPTGGEALAIPLFISLFFPW